MTAVFGAAEEMTSASSVLPEEFIRRHLDIRFSIYLRTDPFISHNVLAALAKAGLVRVFLGVENHVESSLALYRKRVHTDSYTSIKRIFDPLGVNIHIGYITFEPYSSLDNIFSNVEYLFEIGKLFRLGVILEPVRVIPNSTLHERLIADQLMPPGMSYGRITYGYRFVHEEVGQLLREFKRMFCENLQGVAYDFEYYCTVGEAPAHPCGTAQSRFASLLKRTSILRHSRKKIQAMKLLFEYFRSSIAHAKTGSAHLAGDSNHNAEFILAFKDMTNSIATSYADIVTFIKESGGGV